MRGIGDLLLVGALVALILDGILLIWGSSLSLADGLGILGDVFDNRKAGDHLEGPRFELRSGDGFAV